MADLDKNINQLTKLIDADFANPANRLVGSRASGNGDGAAVITELITYILSQVPAGTGLWQILTNKLSNILQSVDYISLFADNVEVARVGNGVDPVILIDPSANYSNTTGIRFGLGNSKIYENANNSLNIDTATFTINGTWRATASFLGANGGIRPRLLYETASSTNPTVIPNAADESAGLGWAANGLSAIAGGVEVARFVATGMFVQVIKSGATQVAAGAAAGEMWKTSGHTTLPDNVIMHGI